MADLGKLEYNIEANTKQLEQAIKSIQRITKSIEGLTRALNKNVAQIQNVGKQTAQASQQASQAVVQSSNKINVALELQKLKVQELRNEFKFFKKRLEETGTSVRGLKTIQTAISQLDKTVKKGNLSTQEFNIKVKEVSQKLRFAERAANEYARSQIRVEQSQRATEATLAKQEAALARAQIRTRNLARELFKMGATREQLEALDQAFGEFKQTLQSGALSTLEFTRAQNKFALEVAKIKDDVARSEKPLERFKRRMEEITKSTQIALGPLSGIAARITAFTSLVTSSTFKIAAFAAAFVGLGAAFVKTVKTGAEAQKQFLQLKGILDVTNKSALLTINQIERITRKQGELTLSSTRLNRSLASLFAASNLDASIDKLDEFLQLSQGLAQIAGGQTSPVEAGRKLIRIFEDPEQNLTALSEAGIRFTKVQQLMIENFIQMGEKGKAIEIIRKRLEPIKQLATESAKGLAGAFDSFIEAINEAFEVLAKDSGVLQPVARIINDMTRSIKDFVESGENSKVLEAIFRIFAKTLENVYNVLKLIVGILVQFEGVIVLAFSGKIIASFIARMAQLIGVADILAIRIGKIGTVGQFLRNVFVANLIPAMIREFVKLGNAVKSFTALAIARFTQLAVVMNLLSSTVIVRLIGMFKKLRTVVVAAFSFLISSRIIAIIAAIVASVAALVGVFKLLKAVISGEVSLSFESLKEKSKEILEDIKFRIDKLRLKTKNLFNFSSGEEFDDQKQRRLISQIDTVINKMNKVNEVIKTNVDRLNSLLNLTASSNIDIFNKLFGLSDQPVFDETVSKEFETVSNSINKILGSLQFIKENQLGVTDIIPREEVDNFEKIVERIQDLSDSLKRKPIPENLSPTEKLLEFQKRLEKVKLTLVDINKAGKLAAEGVEEFIKIREIQQFNQDLNKFADEFTDFSQKFAESFLALSEGEKADRRLANLRKTFEELSQKAKDSSKAIPEITEQFNDFEKTLTDLGIPIEKVLDFSEIVVKRTGSSVRKVITDLEKQNTMIQIQNQQFGKTGKIFDDLELKIKKLEILEQIGFPVKTLEDLQFFNLLLGESADEVTKLLEALREGEKTKFADTFKQDLIDQIKATNIRRHFVGQFDKLPENIALSNLEIEKRFREAGIGPEDERTRKAKFFNSVLQTSLTLLERENALFSESVKLSDSKLLTQAQIAQFGKEETLAAKIALSNLQLKLDLLKLGVKEDDKKLKNLQKQNEEYQKQAFILDIIRKFGINAKDNAEEYGNILASRVGDPISKIVTDLTSQQTLLELQNQLIGKIGDEFDEISLKIKKLEILKNLGFPVKTLQDLEFFNKLLGESAKEVENLIKGLDRLRQQSFVDTTKKSFENQLELLKEQKNFVNDFIGIDREIAIARVELLQNAAELGIENLDSRLNELLNLIRKIKIESQELKRDEFFAAESRDFKDQILRAQLGKRLAGFEDTLKARIAFSEFDLLVKVQDIGLTSEQLNTLLQYNEELQRTLYQTEQLAELWGGVKDAIENAFSEFFNAIIEGQSVLKSFKNFVINIINEIIRKLIKFFIIDRLINGIIGAITGGFSSPKANLGVASSFNTNFEKLTPKFGFAHGGVINKPAFVSVSGKLGRIGEAGPEAVIPLTRIGGKLGVAATGFGGSNIEINIIDQRSAATSEPVQVQRRRRPDGVEELRILIRDQIKGMISSGEFDKTFSSNFGLRRVPVR